MAQWSFFFASDGTHGLMVTLAVVLGFAALGALITFFEHRFGGGWLWLAAQAIVTAAAVTVLMLIGAGLAEVLLYLLLFLRARLCFAFREGREKP